MEVTIHSLIEELFNNESKEIIKKIKKLLIENGREKALSMELASELEYDLGETVVIDDSCFEATRTLNAKVTYNPSRDKK
jgi:hypothetical protein